MTRQNGWEVALAVGDGGAPENFTDLGGLLLSRLLLERRSVTASHLGDDGWRSLLGGVGERHFSVTGEGECTASASEETLRALAFSGEARNWRMDFASGGSVSASCIVTRYERIAEVRDLLTYRLTLESAATASFSTP